MFFLLCLLPTMRWALADSSALEIRYRVRVRGIEDRALRNDLRSVSDTVTLIDRPPLSELQLRRRAERDVPRMLKVLRANGYYAASVDVRLRTDPAPARVRFDVDTGPRYVFRAVRIVPVNGHAAPAVAPTPAEVGLEPGAPALAQVIVLAEDRIVQGLERHGHPFAQVERREVRVEHAAQAVDVIYRYEAGPSAVFGETTIDGLTSVREAFVRGKVPWRPGDPYDGRMLRIAQRRMIGADVFTSVRVVKGDALTDDYALPIRVKVGERKHRSISLGAGYATDEGVRARIAWEHRNLLQEGERLSWTWSASEIGYSTETSFKKPDFRHSDQTLKLTLRAALDEPDAYRSRNVGVLLGLDRGLRRGLVVGAGAGFKYSSVRDADDENRFGLLYFPVYMDWDGSDDVLDPRTGGRATLSAAPYRDVIESQVTFLKARVDGTRYLPLTSRPAIDLALRLVAGTIVGASTDDVPADERYYAGGGGTVRGYAYQSVGPRDEGQPLGGKSLVLASSELRWRINRDFGLVAFVDGGTVYDESVPDIPEDIKSGTGLGLRYFTPVGPLRFDFAVPLNRRAGVDDAFQFYISLGQAF